MERSPVDLFAFALGFGGIVFGAVGIVTTLPALGVLGALMLGSALGYFGLQSACSRC